MADVDALVPSLPLPALSPPFTSASATDETCEAVVTTEQSEQSDYWWEVLVDCPRGQGVYTYSAPADLTVQPGDILSVPFGAQQVGAIALRPVTQLPADLTPQQLRPIADVVSPGFFRPSYWQLLERVAQYYQTPLMRVIRTALPPGLLGRSQRRIRLKEGIGSQGVRSWGVRSSGVQNEETDASAVPDSSTHSPTLSPPAHQLLTLLQSSPSGDYSWQHLQRQVKQASRGLRQLQQQGWVESYLRPQTHSQPKLRQMVSLVPPAAAAPSPTPRQQEVLEVLKRRGGELGLTELLQLCKVSSTVVKALADKGYVGLHQREVLRGEVCPLPPADEAKPLTPDQAAALAAIQGINGYGVALLHGVTGAGKTEVYLQAIAPILTRQQSVLVLVPEIGLTPQLTDRFRARFAHHGIPILLYHSGLSDGERYDAWRQMLDPAITGNRGAIVIGTRSAVFAPLPNLGLLILDEEHDDSFKQDQPNPCYHTRTVAHWRAALETCPLILGSATPALETWVAHITPPTPPTPPLPHSPTPPLSLYLPLPQRVHTRPLPPIDLVDMRQELQQGNRSLFSRSLQTRLHELAETSQQGILFIPRRGHSTFVLCRECGAVIGCPHCDVSLSYHLPHPQATPLLRCHYCNYSQLQPTHCPDCQSPYLKHFGSGTQRVVEEVQRLFPHLRTLRFDSDTTRSKGAHRTLLTQFAQGEADLLVGTQMLTKGIDLPQVTLVGILAADGLLHMGDFRAGERAFQTLIQVAGRAGRGEEPGRVILQTYSPDHAVVQAVQRYDYARFSQEELQSRRDLHYPPYGRLALLRFSGVEASLVEATATQVAEALQPPMDQSAPYVVLGPAPAAIPRVARSYRWQVLLKAAIDPDNGNAADYPWPDLESIRDRCPPNVNLTIDIDPLHLG